MTPKDQAEALQKKCANELTAHCAGYYNDPPGPHFKASMEQIVKDNLCLVELFEVVEWSNNLVNNCATELDADCCEQNTRNALAALHDALKLPKEMQP